MLPKVTIIAGKTFLVGLILFGSSHMASAAEAPKVKLAYKFRMGEVLRYGVTHLANIESSMDGMTQEAETKSESIKAWKVTDVLPNGEIEFVHLVEVVRMSNRVPNRAIAEYDSQRDKSPPPGFDQAAKAVGVPLSVIRMKPSGEIVSREEKHPQPQVTEDMPITLRLPDEVLAVGEEWDETFEVPVEEKTGVKKVRTRRVCTLESVETGIATIRTEYQVLTPVSPFVESQLADRMAKGTVRFDIAKGRIISQQQDVDRRILGFAGEKSVMHSVSRLEERLLKPQERLAQRKPATN
jgi:hypothetical protein